MKFTQDQLIEAYEQMYNERCTEVSAAYKAVDWINNQLPFAAQELSCRVYDGTIERISPYPNNIKIDMVYRLNDSRLPEYKKYLEQFDWVEKLSEFHYEVQSPFGKFPLELIHYYC